YLGCLGVALAAQLLGIAIGLRQYYGALTIGVGPDTLRRLAAARPEVAGHPLALGRHAPVHRFADVARQINALDPHIDDANPQRLRRLHRLLGQDVHDPAALAGNHFLDGATAEFGTQAAANDFAQALVGAGRIASDRRIETTGILNAPLDEGVDDDVLLLRGQEPCRILVEGVDAVIEAPHGVHDRRLEVQARPDIGLDDPAELELDADLGLVDGVHRQVCASGDDDQQRDDGSSQGLHQRTSRSRRRSRPTFPAGLPVRLAGSGSGAVAAGCWAPGLLRSSILSSGRYIT